MEYRQGSKIKDWSVEDRPREKLIKKGIASLSNAEIIALLIGSGSRRETAVELSRHILMDAGNNLNRLGKMTIRELQQYNGIGEAKAIAIVAALELGRRRKAAAIEDKTQIKSSQDVFTRMHPRLEDLPHEEFWVVLLNRANKIIDELKISHGGMTGTVTDVKIILKEAIDRRATGIIMCHNHPSGNTHPSKADFNITRKMKNAAAYLDIQVLDHIITGEKNYYSFADEGTL
jgi:DNA repair protein RadC